MSVWRDSSHDLATSGGGHKLTRLPFRLGFWIALAAFWAVVDYFTPPQYAAHIVHVAVLPLALRCIRRRDVPRLLAASATAAIVPGVLHLFQSAADLATAGDVASLLLPRLGSAAAIAMLTLYNANQNRLRRRRLLTRRALHHRVLRRNNQLRAAFERLKRESAQRQSAQQRLAESEAHLQSLMQHARMHLLRKDINGVFTYASPTFCELLRRRPEEVIGKTDHDIYPPWTAVKFREDDLRVMRTGEPYETVEVNPQPDGKNDYVQVLKVPEYDTHGNVIGIQAVFWDVTDRWRSVIELRRSEARKRALFDAADDGILLVGPSGRIVEANPAAARILRVSAEELTDRDLIDTLLPAVQHPPKVADGDALESHTSAVGSPQQPHRRSDHRGKFAVLPWEMLPQGVRRETSLRRAARPSSPSDGRRAGEPREQRRLSGLSRASGIAGPAGSRGGAARPEAEEVADESFPAELSAHSIPLENTTGLAIFIRDITARQRTQQDLREAKEMAERASEAKSAFLAGVSHEIRTPLGGILGLAQLLGETPLSPRQRQYVELIRHSTDLLSGVIEDILDFSRIEAGGLEIESAPLDLYRCVGDAFKCLAARAVGKGLEMILRIEPEVPRYARGDAVRLRQIVVNLVGNAIKFTGQGEVILTLRTARPDEPHGATPGDDTLPLVLEVTDTGIGIPVERQRSIFEAFQQVDASTTRRFGGTGLGLAISDRIVRAMDGSIVVDSEAGRGSTFRCYLPLGTTAHAEGANGAPPTGDISSSSRQARVVLINASQRESIAAMLRCGGWNVCLVDPADVRASACCEPCEESAAEGGAAALLVIDGSLPAPERFLPHGAPRPRVIWLTSLGNPPPAKAQLSDPLLIKPVLPDELLAAAEPSAGSDDATPKVGHVPVVAAPRARPIDRNARHVLIVDDSPVNRTVLRDLLATAGHRTTTAISGQDAVRIAATEPPDVVLMDLQMPDLDGADAARMIIADAETRGTDPPVIIAVTAHVTESHRRRCFDAGMRGFLTKPVHRDELLRMIDNHSPTPSDSPSPGEPSQAGAESAETPQRATASASDAEWIQHFKRRIGHNDEVLHSMIEAFLIEVPSTIRQLDEALEGADASRVRRLAHTLKSCFRYIGNGPEVAAAARIEQAGRDRALDNLAEDMGTAREAAARWCEKLSAHLAGQQNG